MHLLTYVREVAQEREICRSFDEAPHVPFASTQTVPTFNKGPHAHLLFLGGIVRLRAMDVFSEYPLLISVRSENPQEVRGAMYNSRIGVFGQPLSSQTDAGGE